MFWENSLETEGIYTKLCLTSCTISQLRFVMFDQAPFMVWQGLKMSVFFLKKYDKENTSCNVEVKVIQ